VEDAWRTHAGVHAEGRHATTRFDEPEALVLELLPPPQPLPALRPVPLGSGADGMRRDLARELATAGLHGERADDLVLAACEVLHNVCQHGGGAPAVRLGWVGEELACEISDGGPGLDDPLAGYVPPAPGQREGVGLWVARQLTRRLELISSTGGLTVRLWA